MENSKVLLSNVEGVGLLVPIRCPECGGEAKVAADELTGEQYPDSFFCFRCWAMERINILILENDALTKKRDEAEAALCRAGEFLDTIGSRISDSSPCPHEEEAKRLQGILNRWDETLRGVQDERDRLREAVEWALSPEAYYLFGEHDQAVSFAKELRRRSEG